jgi:hypothetical protein
MSRRLRAADTCRAMKGSELLLAHCSALCPTPARPPAYHRLEQTLGGELARLLVGALASRRGSRARSLRLAA